MKKQTYYKNRIIFEDRLEKSVKDRFGKSAIEPLLVGFRNKELFFKLYSYDRNIKGSLSSIFKKNTPKCFKTWQDKPMRRLKLVDLNRESFKRFAGDYERLLENISRKQNRQKL